LIGVESEVIQRAIANRVGVLILSKGFAVPSYGITRLSDSPGRAAVTLVIKRAVVCPARFLRRRMKSDVTEIGSSTQRHGKGLDAAIEILVEQGVLIVIDARRGIAHFVAHKPDPIVSRIRLSLIYRRPCPSRDGRVRSHGLPERGKCKVRCAVNRKLTMGSVVIHVALPGMGLTPSVLLRRVVLRFREIGCAFIERCVQITDLHANPVRCAVMCVAAVVGRSVRKRAGKRIDPRA